MDKYNRTPPKMDLETAVAPSPIEIEPPDIEGEVLLTLKKKKPQRRHRTRKYHAILTKGYLQLFTNRQATTHRYQIDLSKVIISEENGAIVLGFRVESHALVPEDTKNFEKWKDAVLLHQQYRRVRTRLPSTPKSVETDSGKAVESASSFTTANAFEDWDTMDMCLKMIDDIEQMQGLTIEVLEKMATLAMEMRKVAYEFNSTTGLIQNGTNTDKTTQSLASSFTNTTVYRISEPSLDTVFTKELFITDEDDFERIQSLSHEYDGDVLTADDKPSTQTLHSLQATSNVEQRKNDVIRRSLKILGRKSVGLSARRNMTATPTAPQQRPSVSEEVATSISTPSTPTSKLTTQETEPKTATEGSARGRVVDQQRKPRRERRLALPAQQRPSERISFAALGRMILQRTGVPISHYEPLTALQLLCEELRYSKLLDNACTKNTAEERMVYVAAFAFSSYSNTTGRFRKFFNPLLGETYEYEQDDFKYHGEQVSHHPPVSAGHATGNGWIWYQTFSADITWNTWAQTCEFAPDRPVRLQLKGEEYSWNKITTYIENLLCIPEQRKLSHEGTIHVRCSNGVAAKILVRKNKDVSGEVTNPSGERFCRLSGKWDEKIFREADNGENEDLIVVSNKVLHAEYFGFSDFTMGLNQLYAEDEQLLPPTDSRLRPDVRTLENGDLNKAAAYKHELEKAQRARAINEETYKPLWFEEKDDDFTKTKMFITTGKYWEAKQTRFEQQKKENAFIPIFKVSITN